MVESQQTFTSQTKSYILRRGSTKQTHTESRMKHVNACIERTHMEIQGQAAIVTGGGSGLGAATAKALGEQGAKVYALDLAGGNGKAQEGEKGEYLGINMTGLESLRKTWAHLADRVDL